jgi:hypothetical protein
MIPFHIFGRLIKARLLLALQLSEIFRVLSLDLSVVHGAAVPASDPDIKNCLQVVIFCVVRVRKAKLHIRELLGSSIVTGRLA